MRDGTEALAGSGRGDLRASARRSGAGADNDHDNDEYDNHDLAAVFADVGWVFLHDRSESRLTVDQGRNDRLRGYAERGCDRDAAVDELRLQGRLVEDHRRQPSALCAE